jgi:hypothetical protein
MGLMTDCPGNQKQVQTHVLKRMSLLGSTFNPHENNQVYAQNNSRSNDVTRWRKSHPSENNIAD